MKPKNIKLFYIGRRLNNAEVMKAFQDSSGEKYFFRLSSAKSCFIGNVYEGFADKDVTSIMRSPKILEGEATEEQRQEWEILDTLAADYLLQKKRAKNPPDIKAVVNALKPLCKGLRYREVKQLVESLIEQVMEK